MLLLFLNLWHCTCGVDAVLTVPMCVYMFPCMWNGPLPGSGWIYLCWVLLQNVFVATWSMCAVEKYSSLAGREERQREGKRENEVWRGEITSWESYCSPRPCLFPTAQYGSHLLLPLGYPWCHANSLCQKMKSCYSCSGLGLNQIQCRIPALTRRDDHLDISHSLFEFHVLLL